MTIPEALKILDFTTEAHAKLWLDNRIIGTDTIVLSGAFKMMELEAVIVLVRNRGQS